jgi:hypothetical protein
MLIDDQTTKFAKILVLEYDKILYDLLLEVFDRCKPKIDQKFYKPEILSDPIYAKLIARKCKWRGVKLVTKLDENNQPKYLWFQQRDKRVSTIVEFPILKCLKNK